VKTLTCAFLVFEIIFIHSLELNPDTISSMIENSNYSIKSLEHKVSIMKNNIIMSGFDLMDTSFNYGVMDLQLKDNGIQSEMITHKINVMQDIPISAKLYYKKQSALFDLAISEEDISYQKLLIKQRILDLAVEYKKLSLIHRNTIESGVLLDRILEIANTKYSNGKLLLSDIIDIKIKKSENSKMMYDIDGMMEIVRLEILDILDIEDVNTTITVPFLNTINETSLKDITGIDTEKLFKKALVFYPEYKMQTFIKEQSESNYKESINTIIPDLGVGLGYAFNVNTPSRSSLSFDLSMKIPVFSLPSRISGIKMKEEMMKSQELLLKNYTLNLKISISKIVTQLTSTLNQIKTLDEGIIKNSEDSINSLFQAYQVDRTEISTLLNAIVMLFEERNRFYTLNSFFYSQLFRIETVSGIKYY